MAMAGRGAETGTLGRLAALLSTLLFRPGFAAALGAFASYSRSPFAVYGHLWWFVAGAVATLALACASERDVRSAVTSLFSNRAA
ncbi:MAG: hypothetical protein M0Z51_15180 [Propionibacterium sp.]|nr:hypothetical protein [Propionibacterium sp.]